MRVCVAGAGKVGKAISRELIHNGHDVLHSKARAKDGVARFECKASDSGSCHYTLYPDACAGKADCKLAPLHRFSVARGEVRELSGVRDFRVCVGPDATTLGPDCRPAQPAAPAAP